MDRRLRYTQTERLAPARSRVVYYVPELDYVPRTRRPLRIREEDCTPVIDYTAQYLEELAARNREES